MLIAVMSGFAGALLAPAVCGAAGKRTGWILAALPGGLFLYFLRLLAAGGAVSTLDWAPELGVSLAFRADGLSLLFALLISGIGALVTVYSGGYLSNHPFLGRWFLYLFAFMASMLGLVLADNLYLLFIFWELTSFTSYLLIGFNHDEEASRAAALQALLVTAAGGLALLAGLVILAGVTGNTGLSGMAASAELLRGHPARVTVVVLLLLGAFTKSAQFPFHFWLPNAMAAPTPASAYLHSSTMVKAGVYLVARMHPLFADDAVWHTGLVVFGGATLLYGGVRAAAQTVIKRMLAYSTVAALGVMMLLFGIGTEAAVHAAVAFLFAHALYKAGLFLVGGAVDHATGERDLRRLSGLGRAMPLTAAAAAVVALSMAGVPPLFGFTAKEHVYAAVLASPAVAAVTVAGALLFVLVALAVGVRPFLGRPLDTPKHAHEPSPSLWLPPLALAAGSLGFGFAPGLLDRALLLPAAAGVLGESLAPSGHAAHGGLVLGLSAATLVVGLGLFFARDRIRGLLGGFRLLSPGEPENLWNAGMRGMVWAAGAQTRAIQHGYLRGYLTLVFLALVLLTAPVLLRHSPEVGRILHSRSLSALLHLRFHEVGLGLLMAVSIGAVVHMRTRLAAVAALGVVGYGMAIIFILFGAPDLAMTQFVIETLTVILLVLAFYHLPAFAPPARRVFQTGNLLLAGSVGVVMALLVLVAADEHHPTALARYFSDNSLSLGHGRNVVNVILVDFRALDTLGEITVLALAALGAYAVLYLKPRGEGGKP
ncbi:MAG: DUF4040 domain-containing protein [Candidatus Hydrogenedentes bacterium]|nr:DUF4040 domain-containing protein [Candidatus Hydrogenedentota bacterium]